ncbi:DMT family transporter [Anaerostipes faecalis]|uniref:DMT family transporter n=1 Tax=Anaerostipes faecalis TaxID=2738446 RepID=UPI001C1E5A7F|nr:DMT family transporter [Anaerostipes faecalis]
MKKSAKGMCFFIIGGACWGLSGIMGKYLFDAKGLNAMWLVNIRLLLGGCFMLLMAFGLRKQRIFDVWKGKETAGKQLIFSIFGMAACQLSYFLAVQYSNPGTATVLQYIAPVLILVFCLIVECRFPRLLEITVLASVMTGVFLLSTHGNIHEMVMTRQALFWGLIAALTCAFYSIQPKSLLEEFGSLETVGWGMLIGGIFLIPFVKIWEVPGVWDIQTFASMAGVILIGTVIAFGCYLQGILILGPVKGSVFGCVEPLVATIFSVLLLGQAFEGMDVLGIVCIIAGVTALAVFGEKK